MSHSWHPIREIKVPHPGAVFVHFEDYSLNAKPVDYTMKYQDYSSGPCNKLFPQRNRLSYCTYLGKS